MAFSAKSLTANNSLVVLLSDWFNAWLIGIYVLSLSPHLMRQMARSLWSTGWCTIGLRYSGGCSSLVLAELRVSMPICSSVGCWLVLSISLKMLGTILCVQHSVDSSHSPCFLLLAALWISVLVKGVSISARGRIMNSLLILSWQASSWSVARLRLLGFLCFSLFCLHCLTLKGSFCFMNSMWSDDKIQAKI